MLPGLSDPPRLLGRFRIEAEIAKGGMGTVYSALDDSTGQRVALKRLAAGAAPRVATLFEREFHVLSSLKHPCIIEVYDYGIDADGPFYTMELLEGSDMRELSPLPVAQACRYLCDVASSLALLHARRLLHRDVSPRNVRALADGRCKLIDFGALTSFGTTEELVGTPPAIPPEALAGQGLDQRADLFALGALAYYMLTGRHAYPARTVSGLPDVWAVAPAAVSYFAADVSPDLDRLVMSLLSLDVLARPSSASLVIEQLRVIAGLESEQDAHAAQAYFVGATLVERERELERLQRRLQRVSKAQGGSVFVSAEAGVGKTRFLSEVAVLAQLAGVTALRVDAAAHSGPLSTARALVKQLFRMLPKSTAKVFRPHATELRAVWPNLDEFGRTQPPAAPIAPNPAAAVLPAFIETCICSISQKHALVIAVDNVEQADAHSVALLLTLARAARSQRLLVVSTTTVQASTELPKPVQALREAGTAIVLRALTEDGVSALVRTAFGDVPHVRRTATRLFAATRGNLEHSMRVLQHWVDTHVIEYAGGTWNLPIEISADVLHQAQHLLQARLQQCSESARQIAESLAVLERPAALEFCIELEATTHARRDVMAALDELVQAEVLSLTPAGYRFQHEPLRASLIEHMDAARLRAQQLHVANALLAAPDASIEAQLHAGLLLVRAADALRGAEVIRKLARDALAGPTDPGPLFATAVNALQAAHEAGLHAGDSRLLQLELQVPLVLAGHYISPTFSQRYVYDTIASLEHVLGLSRARAAGEVLDAGALRAVLAAAPVLDPGELKAANAPDVATLVGWLIRSVMAAVATAAASIDHEAQQRFARALRCFLVFGRDHPAAVAYEYCQLVISMSEGHPAVSYAGWTDLLARLPNLSFSPAVKNRLRLGALYSLGALECQRDDDRALARMLEIEREESMLSPAYADQLRFLYYGFRGDIELAQRYRDRVEAHAVQRGSAWQVEMWSTCTLSSVYANTRDAAGCQQCTDLLERLKKTSPSLEQYWERAFATRLALSGATERAIEMYLKTLARSKSNERVGWSSVRGGLARALNNLGRYAEARSICEETIALSEPDLEFVAVTLTMRTELCRALAGLGEFAQAKARLTDLFILYAPNKNPVTLGLLHRTAAEIAKFEGDGVAFDRHWHEMSAWYQPTRNPALIAQCDQLRNVSGQDPRRDPYAAAGFSTLIGTAQSVLAGCEGAQARKLRALELVAAYHQIAQAWLFTSGAAGEPVMVAKLGDLGAPNELVPTVRILFEQGEDDGDETAFIDSEPVPISVSSAPTQPYRVLPLTVDRGTEQLLVGAIAFPDSTTHRSANHAFLQDVATQLFEAGDLTTVRSVL